MYHLLPGKHANWELAAGHKYRAHTTSPEHLELLDSCFVIIPHRDYDKTRDSWAKQGREWNTNLWHYTNALHGFHIHIDNEFTRDARLADLSKLLGVELKTDWQPVNQSMPRP